MAQDIILFARTMPYLTALIYTDNDGSKVYKKLALRPWVKGAHWNSSAAKTYKVYWSKPIPFAGKVRYTYAMTVRWRFEGHRQPEPDEQVRKMQTNSGWILSDDKYYSWIQLPEPERHSRDLQTNYQNFTTTTSLPVHSEGSIPWAVQRARRLWQFLESEHDEQAKKRMKAAGQFLESEHDEQVKKRMKAAEDDSVFLTLAHAEVAIRAEMGGA